MKLKCLYASSNDCSDAFYISGVRVRDPYFSLILGRHKVAILNQLGSVEAGAQGSHKLARGYLPVSTHSLHWFTDQGFSEAVAKYLVAEGKEVNKEINILNSYGPFKKIEIEEQQ